jgi:hypothetical protein
VEEKDPVAEDLSPMEKTESEHAGVGIMTTTVGHVALT